MEHETHWKISKIVNSYSKIPKIYRLIGQLKQVTNEVRGIL